MSLLGFFRRRTEARSVPVQTLELLAAGGPSAVSAERAGGLPIVARCIQARAEGLAALPLRVYERDANGHRRPLPDHPLRRVLTETFNPYLTAFEGIALLSRWCDLHGNALARIELNGRQEVAALWPLPPGTWSAELMPDGVPRYRVTGRDGRQEILLPGEVVHLRHEGRDAVMGVSPLETARETVALALELQDQAIALARNGGRPSGAIVYPGSMSPAQMEALRENLEGRVAGGRNAGRILTLDGGMTWQPFGQTSRDQEGVETRRLVDLQLCRLFGVPPYIAGITEGSNYANAVQAARSFAAQCLAPWARRVEAAFSASLFTEAQRRRLFVEFDLTGLLRGDFEARFQAYRIGRECGALSANDIRRLENLPPVPGGDTYLQPLNMARLGAEAEAAPAEEPAP